MNRIIRYCSVFNTLSLDISAGAVIGMAFFASYLNVRLEGLTYVIMAGSVWIIYTGDHLIDAWRIRKPASTRRHRFHQRYFYPLFLAVAVVGVCIGILVMTTQQQLIVCGSILLALVALYLLVHPYLYGVKELFGGFLYTAGIVLPSAASGSPSRDDLIIACAGFLLIAWINLLMFSVADRQSDTRDRMMSFASLFGQANARRLTWLFYGLLWIVCIEIGRREEVKVALMFLAMGSVLMLLGIRSLQQRTVLFRVIGDGVFFLPLIYLAG